MMRRTKAASCHKVSQPKRSDPDVCLSIAGRLFFCDQSIPDRPFFLLSATVRLFQTDWLCGDHSCFLIPYFLAVQNISHDFTAMIAVSGMNPACGLQHWLVRQYAGSPVCSTDYTGNNAARC